MDFWYKLDCNSVDYTRFGNGYSNLSRDMDDAISAVREFYFSNQPISENNTFIDIIEKGRKETSIDSAIKFTSNAVKDIMRHYFGNDLESDSSRNLQELAFTYFGQGTLFDNVSNIETPTQTRRPLKYMIHMMDGGVQFYGFWHFVVNYFDILSFHSDNKFLTHLDKCMGLGGEIHYKQKPLQSLSPPGINPKNPEMAEKDLEWLKTKWLSLVDINEISEHLTLLLEKFRRNPFL